MVPIKVFYGQGGGGGGGGGVKKQTIQYNVNQKK